MTYKPILLIKYNPEYLNPDKGNNFLKETNDFFTNKFQGYNVFCYPEGGDGELKIELLNAKSLTKAKYKNLVTLISKTLS